MPQYKIIGRLHGMTGFRGQFYFDSGICNVTDANTQTGMQVRHIAETLLPRDYAAYHPIELADEMHQKWLERGAKKDGEQLGANNVPSAGPAETFASRTNQVGGNDGSPDAGARSQTANTDGGGTEGTTEHNGSTESELIQQALRQMDPNDDAIWTNGGLPKLEQVVGRTKLQVGRPDVEQAFPGFNRTIAKQLKSTE